MNIQDKKKSLTLVVIVGIASIILVLLAAYSAGLRVENNDYIRSNSTLQGEIDTLKVKIKSANNVEHIEKVATGKLGMVYPDASKCIYLGEEEHPGGNFAATLKTQAYN
ncbi:Cell division protein FtsL [Peptostreptococcaceae bacterium pGA-8]|nr:Cell division protein FtsL [Peptostreptococcaceae bacterium pGA-8]